MNIISEESVRETVLHVINTFEVDLFQIKAEEYLLVNKDTKETATESLLIAEVTQDDATFKLVLSPKAMLHKFYLHIEYLGIPLDENVDEDLFTLFVAEKVVDELLDYLYSPDTNFITMV